MASSRFEAARFAFPGFPACPDRLRLPPCSSKCFSWLEPYFGGPHSSPAFLKSAVVLSIAHSTIELTPGRGVSSNGQRILAYVGTDTKLVDGAADGRASICSKRPRGRASCRS